jgi:hypothetical protein
MSHEEIVFIREIMLRIEAIHREKAALEDDIRELYADIKDRLDPKIKAACKKAIKVRADYRKGPTTYTNLEDKVDTILAIMDDGDSPTLRARADAGQELTLSDELVEHPVEEEEPAPEEAAPPPPPGPPPAPPPQPVEEEEAEEEVKAENGVVYEDQQNGETFCALSDTKYSSILDKVIARARQHPDGTIERLEEIVEEEKEPAVMTIGDLKPGWKMVGDEVMDEDGNLVGRIGKPATFSEDPDDPLYIPPALRRA